MVAESELVSRTRDAAIQLRYMLPWLEDRRFEGAGGRIIYAVDADVFHAYGAPHEGANIELGKVFFDDDPDLSAALTQRLADHIFFRVSPEKPLLIPPPIEQDVASILNGLVGKFGADPPAIDLNVGELQVNVEKLNQVGIVGADSNVIYELVLRLLYLRTGAAATYRALARLISLDRIAGPEVFAETDKGSESLRRVLRPFESLPDIYDHISLRDQWSERLTAHQDLGARRRANRTRDADCLARLEIWNRRLEISNIKILYITATPSIHEVNLRYEPPISFIRHPRYFLASEAVFRDLHPIDLPTTESAFFGWLYTFVGNISDGERFEDKRPSKLNKSFVDAVLRTEELRPGSSDEIKNGWAKFTREFREAYRPPHEIQARFIEELGQLANGIQTLREWNALRERLDSQIRELTTEAWNDCFFVTTRTGFTVRSESPLHQATPARVVVPIYFDSWRKTRKFIQSVASWHEPSDFDQGRYDEGILDVLNEDPTGYAYYLAHAALFSGRGEWRTAAALCDQAIAVVSSRRDAEETQANGREAHYLGGFCRRHTVKQRRELEPLYAYVRRAKKIYDDERKVRPKLDVIGERFESEELSIGITELMFDNYVPDELSAGKEALVARADDLLRRTADLRSRLKRRISELEVSPDELDKERRCEAARQLLGRINANIISINLSFRALKSADIRELREAFSELAEYSRLEDYGGKEMGKSLFIRSALLVAGLVLGVTRSRKREIEDHFEKAMANAIFPYDRARFLDWTRVALSKL
ncbi:hypothetical protein [Bradyrhizobium sp. HKCCYLS2033]|uniref:hypothetical protein n=1 Tax=unclassified Bradyrhizobium TaxID=2631580 RepID=UPI003EBFCD23